MDRERESKKSLLDDDDDDDDDGLISITTILLQYRESRDPKVAAAGIQTRSGRKWSAEEELRVAEERIKHKKILDTIAIEGARLGYFPNSQTSKAKGKERHQIIQDEV